MKKILLLFVAASALGLTSRAADGDKFFSNDLYYQVTSEANLEVSLIRSSTYSSSLNGEVVIPETVSNGSYRPKTYTVTTIGESAFSGSTNITSVSIPNTVTAIGKSAFYECSGLTSVNIPNSVTTINESTFNGCSSLTTIDIPDTVTTIGESAFGNSGLTYVDIPESVKTISNYSFSGCSDLTSITIPNSITSIGKYAFYDSGLTSVTIPTSVTTIGYSAFERCTRLTSVFIPASVTTIGTRAFSNCSSLTEILVDDDNPEYCSEEGVLFNKDMTTLLKCPEFITTYEIPSSVNTIGGYAFASGALTSVTIPESVTKIELCAFAYCSSLTSVIIPASVTEIGSYAFCESGLTSVPMLDSVTLIESYTFTRCKGLTTVVIPASVTEIDGSAFVNCSNLTSLTIPASVTEIGQSAFAYCPNLTEVNCYAINPPTANGLSYYGTFYESNTSNAVLHVLPESVEAYKAAEVWKNFNIIGDLTLSGVDGVEAEDSDAPAEYFNLNGMRVNGDALTPGLYIKRQGSNTSKVLVK